MCANTKSAEQVQSDAESAFDKRLWCDSSSGCGQESNEAAWPGSPDIRSAIRLI